MKTLLFDPPLTTEETEAQKKERDRQGTAMILRVQQHYRRGGFTLIELIISAALMAIVIGSAYLCLSAGVSGQRLIEARAEGVQSARTALNMMAADLRCAIPMPGKVEFLGMRRTVSESDADNVDFSTRNY